MKTVAVFVLFCAGLAVLPAADAATAADELLDAYARQGPTRFDPAAGRRFWTRAQTPSAAGQPRSCATCHEADPRQAGRHVTTGKPIAPLAPSVNADRLRDQNKIRKWLVRNCKWTLGRECTAQEKGDILSFLRSL